MPEMFGASDVLPEADRATTSICISIINFRTAQMTIECTRSVLDDLESDGIDGHVVLVENGSGDDSEEKLAAWIADEGLSDRVTLVISAVNTGFSGGHNQAIAVCRAAFYLILNSDAVLKRGFCKAMLQAAAKEHQAGLFAPRIDYDAGGQQVSCFRVASPQSELIRGAGTRQVTSLLSRHVVALEMPPRPDQIGWASFACILLRGSMVDKLGPMDEGYFLYFEDTEYCLRAVRSGWKICYVPEAHAIHFRGGSGPVKALAAQKKRMPRYFYASRSRLLYQAHGPVGLWLANFAWIFGRILAHLRVLTGKPIPPSNSCEWRDIWTNISSPLGDRYAPSGTGHSAHYDGFIHSSTATQSDQKVAL
ncbi:glycosyltransferase family 2 protein [Thioclava kandeliae]|uniref:Glycosyltransferase family 2 protein n=1 Tax=Thioclava kandeliae TaxID=3070818 RepID=A0ABV1SMC3_9RHOB